MSNSVKLYAVFLGDDYYPSRGINDYKNSFDTIDEAKSFILMNTYHDWYQIVNTKTFEVIEDKGNLR